MGKSKTLQLVETIKHENQDFEWYPTTNEMLEIVKKDFSEEFWRSGAPSVLDCGAGDGRALNYLTEGTRYAIEKSQPLIQAMDKSIFIVGTEFKEQTLIDKSVDVIFCNPPYSEFVHWMVKVIKEANANLIYFVVPSRWSENESIETAIKLRKGKSTVLSNLDFLDAERSARAKVDILKIELSSSYNDPFTVWFDEVFKLEINNRESSKYEWSSDAQADLNKRLDKALVEGGDTVSVLENLYQLDLAKLMKNYKMMEQICPTLLKELDVNLASVRGALKQKIEGLKDLYWQELFSNLETITNRLCTASRKTMLDKLQRHVHVDFTARNAYAILSWAIKNANNYFDSQLIELVERTTEKASITLYKSNKKVYQDNDWNWSRKPSELARYSLEHRIVLNRVGGLCTSEWSYDKEKYNGLTERSADYLNDVLTVAHNLGFERVEGENACKCEWESNKAVYFHYKDNRTGKNMELMKVRAFYNGNLHIHFNQEFMGRLNVEFGRLKGWLQTPQEAAAEMNVSQEEAASAFKSNLNLIGNNILKLDFSAVSNPLPVKETKKTKVVNLDDAKANKPKAQHIEKVTLEKDRPSIDLSAAQQIDLLNLIDEAL